MFRKANWEMSYVYLSEVQESNDIEYVKQMQQGIHMAAEIAFLKIAGSLKRKAVPCWDDKCGDAVKNRNRAFRVLKWTHNYQHLIEYKRLQAVVQRNY